MMQQFALLRDRTYRRALDVGCGPGTFTSCLAKICAEVVALERSNGALRQAREALHAVPNVTLISGNIRSYPLPPSSFDLIVLAEVVYYLSFVSGDRRLGVHPGLASLPPLCRRLREALVPGGRLLMTNYFDLERGPVSRADVKEFRRLFEEAGLTVETEYEGLYRRAGAQQQFQIVLFAAPGAIVPGGAPLNSFPSAP